MQIRITNKRYCTDPGEYVGRPSVLGNPFVLRQDGSREEVVDKYRGWLWEKIKEGGPILGELHRLKEQARQRELVLVCWCKRPGKEVACHADVIKQAIEWLDRKDRGEPEPVIAGSEADGGVQRTQMTVFEQMSTWGGSPSATESGLARERDEEPLPIDTAVAPPLAFAELAPQEWPRADKRKTRKVEQLCLPDLCSVVSGSRDPFVSAQEFALSIEQV